IFNGFFLPQIANFIVHYLCIFLQMKIPLSCYHLRHLKKFRLNQSSCTAPHKAAMQTTALSEENNLKCFMQ
ncbi:hypothetical protein, partial [uncultured Treponema sp.]|uniref:hypothetical protein n=1 Tax=uncultured Treponema sp. TaxID=162155 RepID=UPI0025E153E7